MVPGVILIKRRSQCLGVAGMESSLVIHVEQIKGSCFLATPSVCSSFCVPCGSSLCGSVGPLPPIIPPRCMEGSGRRS